MKFLTNHPSTQLVILLPILFNHITTFDLIECHAIADASSEPSQDTQRLYPKHAPESWPQHETRQLSNTQLELPPPVAAIQPNSSTDKLPPFSHNHRSITTTSTPTPISSANKRHEQSHTSTTTSNPAQRWIENILINVEFMHMLNERRREHHMHPNDHEDSMKSNNNGTEGEQPPDDQISATISENSDSFASEVQPTDSGEDLLESQLELTASVSSTTTNQMFDQLDEQKLVDSNNVSAIQQMATTIAAPNIVAPSETTNKQVLTCEQAYTQCSLREVCAPTLKAYKDECDDLINNRTSQCSPKCLRAMIALRSSEAGQDLDNCDCQGNEFCELNKQRSQICQPQVSKALEPSSVVSCSVASSICMADQLCSTALGYYYRRCQSLFSQRHCSERCNNSLTILYKQPQAMKLLTCECDGSEEFPCVRYKTYTERLCLHRQATSEMSDSLEQMDAGAADENENFQTSDEDDAEFNLTNDPADMPPTLSGRGDDYGSDSTGQTGGSPSDAELANTNNYFFNGIQQTGGVQQQQQQQQQLAIEDNWIPLVSGRYFTNLQQQRRQQQQQQQKVKQQRKSTQTKRPQQKNVRPRVRSADINRRRHGRPYMFALTSSSGSSSRHTYELVGMAFSMSLSFILLAFL